MLLIIFMVVTPLLQQGVDVQLPETRKPVKMPEAPAAADVAIKADGSVFVGQNWVPGERAEGRVEEAVRAVPEKDVVLKARQAAQVQAGARGHARWSTRPVSRGRRPDDTEARIGGLTVTVRRTRRWG